MSASDFRKYINLVEGKFDPSEDLSKKIKKHLDSKDFKEACKIFNSIDDDDVFAAVAKKFPNLKNYDKSGNYIGSVPNENGWTP